MALAPKPMATAPAKAALPTVVASCPLTLPLAAPPLLMEKLPVRLPTVSKPPPKRSEALVMVKFVDPLVASTANEPANCWPKTLSVTLLPAR